MVIKITFFIQLLVGEGFDEPKLGIEHVYPSEAEIGGVDKVLIVATTSSKPFIDGTCEFTYSLCREIHLLDRMGIIHVWIPTGDRAILGREHEEAGSRITVFTND